MSRNFHHHSNKERSRGDFEDCRILLIGKTGNGKSATGNTILGRKVFKESVGILSATERAQLEEDTRRNLKVVDTPDLFSDFQEADIENEVAEWRYLTSPGPTAILVVVRADVRFTPEEHEIYRKTKERLGRLLRDNLIVVFTMADKVQGQTDFDEQLRKANKELRSLLWEAKYRYVLLNNTANAVEGQPQVTKLMGLINKLPRITSKRTLNLMLLGMTGSGKSATGNSILGHTAFRSYIGMDTVTTECSLGTGTVASNIIKILDTPGIKNPQSLARDMETWFGHSSQTNFDVILFVIRGDERFKDDAEFRTLEKLKQLLGRDVSRHVIIVFTGGDRLSRSGEDFKKLLTTAPAWLRGMIDEVHNRFVVFDNETDRDKVRVLQRDDLLEMIGDVIERNENRRVNVTTMRERPGRHKRHVQPTDTWQSTSSNSSRCLVM